MPYNAGDFIGTETVMIPFNAFSSNDPAASITVTDLANTDVVVFKDASLTERTSASGIAVDIDVDTNVGMHWITLDLSDNTDVGFYVAGSQYIVGMVGVTADAGTVTAWVGGFTIGKAAAVVAAYGIAQASGLTVLATLSSVSALENISAGSVLVQATSAITVFGPAQVSAITALNNLSIAQVAVQATSSLTVYGAAQASAITALENISAGTVMVQTTSAVTVYGVALETTLTVIKGATFAGATDSLEAIRNRGDDAWTTGAGGSSPTVEEIRTEMDDNSAQLAAIVTAISVLENVSSGTVLIQATSALTIYAAAKTTDVTGLNNLSIAEVAVQATSALTVYAAAKTTDITSLNNISAADVVTQCTSSLTIYGTATGTEITALENLSAGAVLIQAASALTTYAGPTKTEMDTGHELLATVSAATIIQAKTDNLPEGIQKNKAFAFSVLMVLDSDGKTPVTGTTVTCVRSIDGAAFGAIAGTVTEVANGMYRLAGLAADSNGSDIIYKFSSASARDTKVSIITNT